MVKWIISTTSDVPHHAVQLSICHRKNTRNETQTLACFFLLFFFFLSWSLCLSSGEGNGKPLQYSCLENPMDEGAWWATVHAVTTSRSRLHFHFSLSRNGEGNGNPLQCSCLENPRDGRAWWAAVYGVAQSRTWLKRLSSSSSMNIYRQLFLSTQLLSCLAIW